MSHCVIGGLCDYHIWLCVSPTRLRAVGRQTLVCVAAHGTATASLAAAKPYKLNICGEVAGCRAQRKGVCAGQEQPVGRRWGGEKEIGCFPSPPCDRLGVVCRCRGEGGVAGVGRSLELAVISTTSLSLEPFFGSLISVALGHWGREVPGPLTGPAHRVRLPQCWLWHFRVMARARCGQ